MACKPNRLEPNYPCPEVVTTPSRCTSKRSTACSRDVSLSRNPEGARVQAGVESDNGLGGHLPPRPRSFAIRLPIARFHQAELVVTAGSGVECQGLYVAGRIGRLEQGL